MNDRLINWIGAIITVTWFASNILDAVNPNYDPPYSIHLLMAAVAAAAFAKPKRGGSHEP